MEYQRPIYDISIKEALHLGVDEVAFVHDPAIQELWVAMANEITKLLLSEDDKMIVTGPALVPDKLIYRVHPKTGAEYYIRFSEEVIQQIVQRYFTQNKQINFNLEHNKENDVQGVIIESWIVKDPNMDQSVAMGFKDIKKGTWMISVKVEDEQFWNDYVKTKKTLGFSIEGAFGQNLAEAMANQELVEPKAGESKDDFMGRCIAYHVDKEGMDADQATAICYTKFGSEELAESYTDYPESAKEAAARGIKYNEENGNKCATQTGKVRAQQIANGEPLSYETLKRTYSFLSRAKTYYNPDDTKACGTISYLLWGGEPMLNWVERKLQQIEKLRVGEKIGYDFDGTISTRIGQAMAEKDIKSGSTVYIISARSSASGMYRIADKLGIPHDRVFAMGGNLAKAEKVKELGLDTFYDNNRMVRKLLPKGIGVNFTLSEQEIEILIRAAIEA